ncbi:MAG: glycosyltransferase [Treponema sp.]
MFSVEVTTYNQKEYIAQTLHSIIYQKHSYKYEILVSDDCSTDGTQDVIREFEKKYPEIVKPVYNKKNLGAMANYYATVSRAKGKYLMGCAGDDYWLPGKVEKQISFMERNLDFDICYGKADCIDEINKVKMQSLGMNYLDFKDVLFRGNNCPALTLCIRTSFFKNYLKEIEPDKKNWIMEDYPFLIYAAFEKRNFFFFNESLAVYRILSGSLSHPASLKSEYNFVYNTYELRKFFANKYHENIENWNPDTVINSLYQNALSCSTNKSMLKTEYNLLKKEFGIKNEVKIGKWKKIIKAFIPYGIIRLIQIIKNRKAS